MLYGREAEMRRIDSLLESVRAGKSGVLVLRGEAGIGKTALLGYATERSSGMTVLRARGIETEARLAFSGLADLFRPVIDRLALIPSPQSAALAGALGLGPPVAGDRFVVCIATLSILAAAAEVPPVLVVVDDSHWLDEASREALFFAARRLEAEHVALVATATDSTTIELGSTGLEELVISGLDPGPCLDLLSDQVSSPVAPDVANRLCLATRGNPLALREVVSQLSKQQLSGEDHLQDPLPAAETVENALIRDLQQLPGETRTALVVSAASSGSLSTVIEACRLLGISASALEVAEQAGVIRDEDDLIVFSHPLVRAAVYHAALKTERVRAHTALADALELQVDDEVTFDGPASAAERRSWQLAAAALRPSERVATALEQTAMSARSRSGYAASAYALERAAELTPRTQQAACGGARLAAGGPG